MKRNRPVLHDTSPQTEHLPLKRALKEISNDITCSAPQGNPRMIDIQVPAADMNRLLKALIEGIPYV